MPARYGHALLTLCCVLTLVSCRERGIKPQTEDPVMPPLTRAGISQPTILERDARVSQGETKGRQATASLAHTRPAPGMPAGPINVPPHAFRFSPKSEVYDRNGEAFELLQSPQDAMHALPADTHGKVDWVSALAQGLIKPRANLSGRGRMKRRFDAIVMRKTRDMPWVSFPHAQHTEWLDCSNCHPEPFRERKGGNEITMDTIMRGKHCGTCHDRVAFSIFACERCHSIPHAGSPTKWW